MKFAIVNLSEQEHENIQIWANVDCGQDGDKIDPFKGDGPVPAIAQELEPGEHMVIEMLDCVPDGLDFSLHMRRADTQCREKPFYKNGIRVYPFLSVGFAPEGGCGIRENTHGEDLAKAFSKLPESKTGD